MPLEHDDRHDLANLRSDPISLTSVTGPDRQGALKDSVPRNVVAIPVKRSLAALTVAARLKTCSAI